MRGAEEILKHSDARLEGMDGGKAMIVCMSRGICVEVYNRIVAAWLDCTPYPAAPRRISACIDRYGWLLPCTLL